MLGKTRHMTARILPVAVIACGCSVAAALGAAPAHANPMPPVGEYVGALHGPVRGQTVDIDVPKDAIVVATFNLSDGDVAKCGPGLIDSLGNFKLECSDQSGRVLQTMFSYNPYVGEIAGFVSRGTDSGTIFGAVPAPRA